MLTRQKQQDYSMTIPRHSFTDKIVAILDRHFPELGEELLIRSSLVQYLNKKTRAANRGSKARPAYANHYALYVLIEDYVKNNFDESASYRDYEGAKYTDLLSRQRQLPFGKKLQNHALNHRLNQEFRKYFPLKDVAPIIRDTSTNRYWINERLLKIGTNGQVVNICRPILEIIETYVATRMKSFEQFIETCRKLQEVKYSKTPEAKEFVRSLLRSDVDARIFEIVSYAILKQHYMNKIIYWGWNRDELNEELLMLYKTGRTNANDGGIDFIMRPLGRVFQVTETVDAGKYFLDIDKVQHYPVTFVIKSENDSDTLMSSIREQASIKYGIDQIVRRYIECIEEIINVPELIRIFEEVVQRNKLGNIVDEIVLQSRIEFNVDDEISHGFLKNYH